MLRKVVGPVIKAAGNDSQARGKIPQPPTLEVHMTTVSSLKVSVATVVWIRVRTGDETWYYIFKVSTTSEMCGHLSESLERPCLSLPLNHAQHVSLSQHLDPQQHCCGLDLG